jgi:hypothetical protein
MRKKSTHKAQVKIGMKITIAILVLTGIVSLVILTACRKQGVQADVDAAIANDQYQFIALLDQQGKWTYPQVPEIPDWYFQTTGISIRQTTPATFDADIAYMKSYNDALYQTLKAQGKFKVIEDNIARVKANLEKYRATTNATVQKN